MEAATASAAPLLSRDGADPVLPTAHDPRGHEPIDGAAQCSCCGRYPLVGEVVVRHDAARRRENGWACEACEAGNRTRRLGPAVARARVRSFGGAMNVRRLA
jgi:hypothetical protein